MRHLAVAVLPALPVELQLDAMVAVGMHHAAGRADDNGTLLAMDGRARMQLDRTAVGRAGADRIDAVAVQRPLGDTGGRLVLPAVAFLADRQIDQAAPQQRLHTGLQLRAQVVMHQVDHAHDQEAAAVVAGCLVEPGLALQGENRAGRHGAHRACANMDFPGRFQRL